MSNLPAEHPSPPIANQLDLTRDICVNDLVLIDNCQFLFMPVFTIPISHDGYR